MAAELQVDATTGQTVYFMVRSATGTIWNTAGAALEAYNAANIADYDIAATEQGSSGLYVGNMPAAAAGVYNIVAKVRAGGSPAESDVTVGVGELEWSGSAVLPLSTLFADGPNTPTKGVEQTIVFMMVDATDLNSPETGITVTATISKDGGAFASCTNSVSEISGGLYKITLTSTEKNADIIALKFTGTGCAQRNLVIVTQPT